MRRRRWGRAAAALGAVLAAGDPPDGGASRITAAQGLVAAADSAVASVRPLLASLTDSEELRELVAIRLQDALALYFEMGQRLRLPARSVTPLSRNRASITLAAPGEPGFDLWCLNRARGRGSARRGQAGAAVAPPAVAVRPRPSADAGIAGPPAGRGTGRHGPSSGRRGGDAGVVAHLPVAARLRSGPHAAARGASAAATDPLLWRCQRVSSTALPSSGGW